MSDTVFPIDPESLLISTEIAKKVGFGLAKSYQAATPYHHICVDNFLPEEVLERVLLDLDELPDPEGSFTRAQENLKSSYIPERLPNYTKNFFTR